MSAETLRKAAALMREWAEAAQATGVWRGDMSDKTTGADGALTHHVATFARPDVALAVADWLDATAAENDAPDDSALGFLNFISADAIAALAVARAYLGEDA